MGRIWFVMVVVVFGVTALTVSAQEKGSDTETVVKGNSDFAVSLYSKLKEKEAGNLFFSPYSISVALAMTYAGARGDTAAQMEKVLDFTLGQEKLHSAFSALSDTMKIQKQEGIELSIANALWGQTGYIFLDDFLDVVKKFYGAGLRQVDFAGDTEGARQTINKWVEEQTKEKIKELIKKNVITPLTRLVLTNAIYFKGDWAIKFDKNLTKDADFTQASGEKVKVPTMFLAHLRSKIKNLKFKYGEDDALQILEMPYVGEKVSMVVLLPKKADGLADVEKNLNSENLNKWVASLSIREVNVYLPRFKVTCEFGLNEVLKEMGMPDAFDESKADFSGMNGKKNLFIQAVVHKAYVDVNEEGTEAAAATAVIVGTKSVPQEPPTFRADHPFIFLIKENSTGSILFIGRVMNPKEAEK